MADSLSPTNKNVNLQNNNDANTKNRALDVRRDTDAKKNPTITLLDIDTAIIEHLKNTVRPTVLDAGAVINVPIIYGNPERWKAAQVDGAIKDQNGKLQLPAMMIKRTSFTKNDNYQTFNRYLSYPVIQKYSAKNKYDDFTTLNESVAPVNQIYSVTFPDNVKVEYECIVCTELVEQMNGVLEKINFATQEYWGDPQRFKFRVTVENYDISTDTETDADRIVKATFNFTVYAYLLAESFEDRKLTTQKALTPRQVKVTAELTEAEYLAQLDLAQKDNSDLAKNYPYYNMGVAMSSNKDSWQTPGIEISKEISVVSNQQVEQIRKTYAALIQQTVVYEVTNNIKIWHDPPTASTDPGQEGWMAYDGDYHYIYAGGRWLRHAIDNWS
jgi:hypothetical protein